MPKYIRTEEGYKTAEEVGVATTEEVGNAMNVAEIARTMAGSAQITAEKAQATAEIAQATAEKAQVTADGKISVIDPVGTGSFSMNRKADSSIGSYSMAAGYNIEATGQYSNASGVGTIASNFSSHVIGAYNEPQTNYFLTDVYGVESAERVNNVIITSDKYSITDGVVSLVNPIEITITDQYSYSIIGNYVKTLSNYNCESNEIIYVYNMNYKSYSNTQTIYGILRKTKSEDAKGNLFMIGNGESDNVRSNAHTLDWSGNAWYSGDVYVGSTSGTNRDEGSRKLMANRDTSFVLTDTSTAFQYTISIDNGSLVSSPRPFTYTVTTAPTTVTYTAGEYFDATGMVTAAVYDDGSSREVTDYQFPAEHLTAGTTEVTITATILGTEYSATTAVAVNSLDPTVYLADYTYTDNGDGTYTVTGWADTTKTDELVIPNNAFVTIGGSEE